MLVFFIHGVNTKDASYAAALIDNVRKELDRKSFQGQVDFYSGFWGNLFNNKKNQIIGCIDQDFSRACKKHSEYRFMHGDIYRYQDFRKKLINGFLGDFLIYQNPDRGRKIRTTLSDQLIQFLKDHPNRQQIHFVAHSLGSLILWDLLFSENFPKDDPAFLFRNSLKQIDGLKMTITTLGSPLLFLKQMLDFDFSVVRSFAKNLRQGDRLRWINVLHSSDMVAYPLGAAISDELGSEIFFSDQYVWQDANGTERAVRTMGKADLAMVIAAEDAHGSYFADNLDGAITGRLITYNLLGKTEELSNRCVTPDLN